MLLQTDGQRVEINRGTQKTAKAITSAEGSLISTIDNANFYCLIQHMKIFRHSQYCNGE